MTGKIKGMCQFFPYFCSVLILMNKQFLRKIINITPSDEKWAAFETFLLLCTKVRAIILDEVSTSLKIIASLGPIPWVTVQPPALVVFNRLIINVQRQQLLDEILRLDYKQG